MARFTLMILFATLVVIGGLGWVVYATSFLGNAPVDGALAFDINYEKKKFEQQEGVPGLITIASINVASEAARVELDESGSLKLPPLNWNQFGWYSRHYRAGKPGTVIIAGLRILPDRAPGPFSTIDKIKTGDEIIVKDLNGKEYVYIVTEVVQQSYEEAPKARLLLRNGKAYLNLITYKSPPEEKLKEYIVYSELKQ